MKLFALFALSLVCFVQAENDHRIRSGEDLVSSVMNECQSLSCVKHKVLNYLDTLLGLSDESARSFQPNNIDKVIFKRVARVLKTHEFKVAMPGGVDLKYNPVSGLDLEVAPRPEDDPVTSEARGILKKKLLLPVLLLLKLKMKALMPIFVAIIGLKALKALILSKLAITLVVGFLVYTLFFKGGMPMPMSMMPMMSMTPMPMTMSPEPPSNAYGSPNTPAPPVSSYEPSWEPSPSNNGPYSRIWSSSSDLSSLSSSSSSGPHGLAYSAYYSPSSSSSGSSTSSPSS